MKKLITLDRVKSFIVLFKIIPIVIFLFFCNHNISASNSKKVFKVYKNFTLAKYKTHIKHHQSQKTDSIKFIGAELFANYNGKDSTTIYLKRYINCNTELTPNNEVVVLFEKDLGFVYKTLALKIIDKTSKDNKTRASCENYNELDNCITIITYSVKTKLNIMPSGYYAVWKHGALSTLKIDLNSPKDIHGLALTIHIPDPMEAKINHLEGLRNLEEYKFCNGSNNNMIFKSEKEKKNFSIISLFSPDSYKALSLSDQEPNLIIDSNSDFDYSKLDIPEKILFQAPPYKSISKIETTFYDYSRNNDKAFKLNKESGVLKFNPQEQGQYLLGISKVNTHYKTPLNYHQAVFILQIK
ncbi:MAG: hypothetical protein ACI8RP_000383 [Urechidicola sp.]|jgi:hypothetical protein